MTASTMGASVDQTSYRLLCTALQDTVRAGPHAHDRGGSIRYRASAVLYLLLLAHPIDRRGRCRACRGSGATIGLRRRACRIHLTALDWLLRHPDAALLSQLTHELGTITTPSTAANPTDRPGPTVTARCHPSDPSRTPAVPPPLPPRKHPRAGRPAPLVITGGIPWPR